MRLVLQLVGRLFIVVILCLGAATVWATIDAHRSVDRATAASAERVSVALEALYWRELLLRSSRMREQLLPVPQWRTIETMGLISPGICVQIEPAGAFERPLCGQSKGIGQVPPRWFAASVHTLLGSHAPVIRPISARAANAGSVSATPDPNAAIALAWQHILDNIHLASADGGGDRAARIAGDCAYAGARTADRCRPAAHGARPIPDLAAALPVDGSCHDRASGR